MKVVALPWPSEACSCEFIPVDDWTPIDALKCREHAGRELANQFHHGFSCLGCLNPWRATNGFAMQPNHTVQCDEVKYVVHPPPKSSPLSPSWLNTRIPCSRGMGVLHRHFEVMFYSFLRSNTSSHSNLNSCFLRDQAAGGQTTDCSIPV